MKAWQTFGLNKDQYLEVKTWWLAQHPETLEDALGVVCWDDWVQEILNP